MNYKRVSILALIVLAFISAMFFSGCGCSNTDATLKGNYISSNDVVTETTHADNDVHTTVSQPQVNTENFPSDYIEIQKQVYKSVATPKMKKDGKVTGSDMLKIIGEHKGKVTEGLKKKIKNEVMACVSQQVEGVTCKDVILSVSETDETEGYLTVKYTYNETGGEDINIFNVSLG